MLIISIFVFELSPFSNRKKYFNLSCKTFSWHWQYHSEDRSIHTPLHIDTFYLHLHLFGKAIFTVVIINATIYLVHFIIIYKIFGFIDWVDKVNWLHSTLAHTILYAVWSTAIYSVFNRCNHQSVELAGKYLNFPRSSIQIISKQID